MAEISLPVVLNWKAYQIDPDRIVNVHGKCEFELRPNTVSACNEIRISCKDTNMRLRQLLTAVQNRVKRNRPCFAQYTML